MDNKKPHRLFQEGQSHGSRVGVATGHTRTLNLAAVVSDGCTQCCLCSLQGCSLSEPGGTGETGSVALGFVIGTHHVAVPWAL